MLYNDRTVVLLLCCCCLCGQTNEEKDMTDIVVSKNYASLTGAEDFRCLCQPLLTNTDIASCCYVRLYENGSYFHLATDPKLNDFILFKSRGKFLFDVRVIDTIYNNASPNKNKAHMFAEDVDNVNFLSPMHKLFKIKSNFNVIEKIDDYYEAFWFITSTENPMHSFYVNHYDVLERFMLYFKEQGQDLIKTGEKNKITWFNNNPKYHKLLQNLKEGAIKKNNHLADIKNSFKLKKYPLNNKGVKAYITSRELECLIFLSKGFSYKEIGHFLQVSDRTVETHIQHIKNKLGVGTQDQLLRAYYSSALTIYDEYCSHSLYELGANKLVTDCAI